MNTQRLITASSLAAMLLFCCACDAGRKPVQCAPAVNGPKTSSTLSTDISELRRWINLSAYEPESARFRRVFIDNSGSDRQLSVPGPSDSYFQALLWFDSMTFRRLADTYRMDSPARSFDRSRFAFEWLDSSTRSELLRPDAAHRAYTDHSFELKMNSGILFLDRKILLTYSD